MLYFENAQLEFFGVPMAYLPYFSTPDPTVKRKTGFLMPGFSQATTFGYAVETPFYWAIAPDYDATFNPRFTTRQGVLFQGEFRQRLINGSYQIRAYGIDQLEQSAYAGQPGDRQFRGGVDTKGQFAINDKWVWGWDGVLLSDYYFFSDYRLAQYKDPLGSFLSLPTEAISQLYLTGVGNRSFFDARTIYYLSFSGNQNQVPVIYPVIDYNNVINSPILGGEFSYKTNFTNLSRETAAFDPITTLANTASLCTTTYAGKLPNEDAQSMVFDASNLFAVDKFSGYDRVEGGGRANVGVQATTQFDRGGSINMLFGQSYQLFGLNSYAVHDATNTGLDSGLQNTRSDYVARINYSPNRTYTFSVRTRMDEATQNINRFEAEGRAAFDRWSVSMIYGNYAAQPELGYLTRREGLLGSASVKVASNWVVSGSARWDLEANKLNQYIVGAGYVDDCFVLAANYVTSYNYSAGTTPPVLSHAFMLQIGLRTLANSSSSAGGAGIQ